MKELWQQTWFKIVIGAVIVVVLYLIYSLSTGNLTSLQIRSAVDSNGFPAEFAGYAGSSESAPSDLTKSTVPAPYYDSGAGTTSLAEAKIIQTGFLRLEVDQISKALDDIVVVVSKYSGFVISKNFTESTSGYKTGTAQIKVPVDKFSLAMTEIKGLANFVAQETANSQDVTEEYTDLQSQLKNLQAEEAQYQVIMRQAVKIEDILSVASKLADVRGRIETIQGRIKYYDARTDYSIINIQLSEEHLVNVPANKWRPWEDVKASAQKMVVQLQNFVTNIIGFVFWLLGSIPYLLLIVIIYWLVRKVIKKRPKANL